MKALSKPNARALFPDAKKGEAAPAAFSIRAVPVQEGDVFLGKDQYYGYVRVESLGAIKDKRYIGKEGRGGERKYGMVQVPVVYFRKYLGVASAEDDVETEDAKRAKPPLADWTKAVDRMETKEFAERYSIRVTGTIAEFEAAALEHFLKGPEPEVEAETVTDTRLQAMSSHQQLEAIERMVAEKQNQADAMNRVMKSKLDAFQEVARGMQVQMDRVRRAIGFLNTYLGTWQKMFVIQEGEPAPATEPIAIRQLILFMDEETGDPRLKHKVARGTKSQRGIDWQNVDDFDTWLTADPANLERVLPDKKGLVAIRPSRQSREYSNDWREQAEMEAENKWAYLLVRNGANLYRIWLGDTLGKRLYPKLDEYVVDPEDPFAWSKGREIEEIRFGYQGNMALIQGILDRTDVFKPLPHYLNLNESETWHGLINLVRDAEASSLLGDGHLRWEAWKDEINSKIVRGTRVFFGPGEGQVYSDSRQYHYVRWYSKGSCPPGPGAGVYTVEGEIFPDKVKGPEERQRSKPGGKPFEYEKYMWPGDDGYRLFVLYNPKDQIYNSSWSRYDKYGNYIEPHERKNRIGWWLDTDRPQVLNYDLMTLEDVEYFLGNRLDRHHFLDMVVTLWELRDELTKERAWETQFVKAMAGRLECGDKLIWEAVDWWKHKVIWKRALNSDDAKAWRMIEKRVRHALAA